MKYSVKPIAFAVGAALLASGCTLDEQDAGSSSLSFNGSVIDPYIQRADVWADVNNNGKIDDFELGYVVKTDSNGKFIDLVLPENLFADDADVILRSRGGYDSWTTQSAQGDLVMRVNASQGETVVLSPMSTLASRNNSYIDGYLAGLDFDSTIDYLANDTTAEALVGTESLKIHKTLLILADDMANGNEGLSQSDALETLYDQLGQQFSNEDGSVENASDALNSLLDNLPVGRSATTSGSAVDLARAALGILDSVLTDGNKLTQGQALAVEAITRKVQTAVRDINNGSEKSKVVEEIKAIDGSKLGQLAEKMTEQTEQQEAIDFDLLVENIDQVDENLDVDSFKEDLTLSDDAKLPIFDTELAYKINFEVGGDEEKPDQYTRAVFYLKPNAADENGQVTNGELNLCVDYNDGKETHSVVIGTSMEEISSDEYAKGNYDLDLEQGLFLDIGDWTVIGTNRMELALEFPFLGRLATVLTLKGEDEDRGLNGEDYTYKYQLESTDYDELSGDWFGSNPLDWLQVSVADIPTDSDSCEL